MFLTFEEYPIWIDFCCTLARRGGNDLSEKVGFPASQFLILAYTISDGYFT
jgi:hypothetical protein